MPALTLYFTQTSIIATVIFHIHFTLILTLCYRLTCVPPKIYVKVLTPRTLGCVCK